jgi:rod shape determining protein RodA
MVFDYHSIVDRAEVIYVSVLVVLFYLVLFGGLRAGTNRWLELGFGTFQPGELAKIGVVVFLAKYYSAVRKNHLGSSEVVITGLFAGLPIVLIALQPDLGTAATIAFVYISMALLAGVRKRLLVAGVIAIALALPLGWSFVLKDYQKERVYAFLDPSRDPKGSGYQSIQSTIASAPEASREKAGSTGPRVSSSFCRLRTPISCSPSWPRSSASSESRR